MVKLSLHCLLRPMRTIGAITAFVIGVAALMLWLTGYFGSKIGAEANDIGVVGVDRNAPRAVVDARKLPIEETAVGTVQPVHRVELASRLMAKVAELNLVAGQAVKKGQVLARLEDSDLRARLMQAEARLAQSTAEQNLAKLEAGRLIGAAAANAASPNERDRAIASLQAADANVLVAEQAISEAKTLLAFATIESPMDGVVVDKRMNVGDTTAPGQVIVTLLDPARMQLVASVRESLSQRLSVGGSVTVTIDSLGHGCTGTVSEIVPEAQGSSRSFLVKVTGPCPPGVYAGMFGRLVIPLGTESVLLAPQSAVRRTGQLDFVLIVEGDRAARRLVRIGRSFGTDVEVLSGLRAGEQVLLADLPATRESAHE